MRLGVSKKMIAIYTPTYNRATELKKLYTSLIEQIDQNFFWLVIDDGSTDETENLINEWINDSKITIQYIKKENGGKHSAINLALDIVDDYWNMCIDSDDWLLDRKSVYRINEDICKWKKMESINSIVYPYKFDYQEFDYNNRNYAVIKDFDFRNKRKNILEATIVSRPGSYKGIRFPMFTGEKFIAESAIEIPKLYNSKAIYISNPVVEGHYLEDGLSNNIVKLWSQNPVGYYFVRNLGVDYYKNNRLYIKTLKPLGQMIAFNIYMKQPLLNCIKNKGLGIVSIPFGIIYWLKKFKNV